MKAKLIYHKKNIYEDYSIVEIRIWEIPKSERYPFGYKYSFVYIQNKIRVIGYDNAEGKGDHRHFYDQVAPYNFIGLERLFTDFMDDLKTMGINID